MHRLSQCPYTLQLDAPHPQNCPFPFGIWTPILYVVPWAHPSPQPKRHLDRSTIFAGLISVTDRPTDHATRSVTIGRIYVVLRCGLRIITSGQSKTQSNFTKKGRIAPPPSTRTVQSCSIVFYRSNTCFHESTSQTESRSFQQFLHSYGRKSLYFTMGCLSP